MALPELHGKIQTHIRGDKRCQSDEFYVLLLIALTEPFETGLSPVCFCMFDQGSQGIGFSKFQFLPNYFTLGVRMYSQQPC